MSKVRDLPENTGPANDDLLYIIDSSTGPNSGKKIKHSTLRTAGLPTASETKSLYESNTDTNAFTDVEKTKLAGIETGATADQNADEVPYDNTASGLSAIEVQSAIDEVSQSTQADFRPSIVSGRILHYTSGTARFDGVFYALVAGDILLSSNITNGEVYVDLDGIVKQTGSGVLAPPLSVVFAKFSTDLNDITSFTDERVKNSQNVVRGLVTDVRDVRAGAAASEGTSGRISDAMHKHPILTAAPSTQTPDQSNTEGTSISLSRADHIHYIPAAAPTTTLSPATTNNKGVAASVSLSDHTHAIATGIVSEVISIQPNDTAAAGTVDKFARIDHRHAITTAAPSTQTPDQTNTDGSSTSFSKADHVHNIPTATAVGLDSTSTSTQGSNASFARSNHTHAIATGTPSTQTPDQSNAAGSSANLAKADHTHNIPTATPVTSSTSSTNTQGSASSFAKSDHIHNITVAYQEVTATADDTTTSLTDVLIVSMTATPVAGTYLVRFDTSGVNSGNGAERNFYSLYLGGSQVSGTERAQGIAGGAYSIVTTSAIITANGSQAIEARWRVAGGTGTVHSRKLILLRIG